MQLKSERFEMRLDPQTLHRVEAWRAEQPDRPSRAEVVRRLVGAGLATSGKDEVRFSAGEKLILSMLCDLYKHHGRFVVGPTQSLSSRRSAVGTTGLSNGNTRGSLTVKRTIGRLYPK